MDLSKFDSIRVSKKIPELKLMLWISHDKPLTKNPQGFRANEQQGIRMTAVSILLPWENEETPDLGKWDGLVFTGISGCSEKDTFEKKDGFNRAYGRACQKLVNWYLFNKGNDNCNVDLVLKDLQEKDIKDVNGWISKHAFQAKLEFAQRVFQARLEHKGEKHDINVL